VHLADTLYCCPVLSQFSPIAFFRLTVQYHDLENSKPVHLAHTDYSCLVNEPVHSNPILPAESTVTSSGTSQTSASCPYRLQLPCLEPVHSNPILPSESKVTCSGTSQTSASCPHNLLLPCPDPVRSNPILPSDSTIPGTGKSQTSDSCPHRSQLTCQ